MILGNESIVQIDGATYIRAANLGRELNDIARDMGMGLDARETMNMAIDELIARLKTQLYKEVDNVY